MEKRIQLTILEPCHQDWENMKPSDKGRFCNACQKQVVDFTHMSDAQLIAFFKKPSTGSVCGRLNDDQANRDIILPRKRIPWIKYFFQFSIPAFLLSTKAAGQGLIKLYPGDTVVVTPNDKKIPAVAPPVEEVIIRGRVTASDGAALTGVTIMISGTHTGTATIGDGSFQLRANTAQGKIVLVASYVGFSTEQMTVDTKNLPAAVLFQLHERGIRGEIVVMGGIKAAPLKKGKTRIKCAPVVDSSIKKSGIIKSISNNPFKGMKVFPNPVMQGTTLHIEYKKIKEGYYRLELWGVAGDRVYQREVWVDDKARLLDIQIPALASGNYLLRVTAKESGKGNVRDDPGEVILYNLTL